MQPALCSAGNRLLSLNNRGKRRDEHFVETETYATAIYDGLKLTYAVSPILFTFRPLRGGSFDEPS